MLVVDEDATLELKVKTVKYFQSIEKVANELGFRQMLPRKRDSVVEDQISLHPGPQKTNGKLGVPKIDVSRSASPVLEPMSARISDEVAPGFLDGAEAIDEPQLSSMSERVEN
jgi:glucosamine-6-phosphate deaminase